MAAKVVIKIIDICKLVEWNMYFFLKENKVRKDNKVSKDRRDIMDKQRT